MMRQFVQMKSIFNQLSKRAKIAFFIVTLSSLTASAGMLKAYTHNLRVSYLMLDMIYWSEIGYSGAGITVGH